MPTITNALATALAADRPLIFGAVEVNLPGGVNLRLLDGSSEVTFGGSTFVGRDPTFGTLGSMDPPDDGGGDMAPAMTIAFNAPTDADAANLSASTMQGSRVRFWIGAINASGSVVSDPYLLFDGELDVPRLKADKSSRNLEYDCVSAMERLFSNDEGHRLSLDFWQSVWPGDTGLDDVTGITKTIWWGPGDKPQNVYGNVGTGIGGGGSAFGGIAARIYEAQD